MPVHDPLYDTVFDPVTRMMISEPLEGIPALLDKLTVTKPDISSDASARLTAPRETAPGEQIEFTFRFKNRTSHPLSGTQVVIRLPHDVSFVSASDGTTTVQGRDVVVSLGRTVPDQAIALRIEGRVADSAKHGEVLTAAGTLRSSTALPVFSNTTRTKVEP